MFPRRVTEWAGDREVTRDLVREYLRSQHLGHDPEDGEVEGAFTHVSVHLQDPTILTAEFAIEMMLKTAALMVERVLALHWTVEVDRHARFFTSDVPVIPWRKVTERDHYEGIGVANAPELRFPLDPAKQLVLSTRERRASMEVHDLRVRRANATMASACHRFIVGSPKARAEIDAQHLDRWRPVIRFNAGQLVVAGPHGELHEQPGELIQSWAPRGSEFGRPRRRGC